MKTSDQDDKEIHEKESFLIVLIMDFDQENGRVLIKTSDQDDKDIWVS